MSKIGFIASRPRRNRTSPAVRNLVQETQLSVKNLIAPLFLIEGSNQRIAIQSMPGQFRFSADTLLKECGELQALGVPAVALFPVIADSKKDSLATESKNPHGLLPQTVSMIKKTYPDLLVITDVAMDPYSSDGHDGLVKNGIIENDSSLPILAEMAITQARAGADWVAPSDMMDGRIGFIRRALDEAGFEQVGILAYTAKYASAFYGPFREALDSAPRFGDKKTYQMNPSQVREAIREVKLDELEGADVVMVKPGLPYLDVVRALRENTTLPVAVYNVSGEYAMIKAASEKGWIDEPKAVFEMLTSFRRAGADMILTYFAKDVAKRLSDDQSSKMK
jgi:porphobilinogen synthase